MEKLGKKKVNVLKDRMQILSQGWHHHAEDTGTPAWPALRLTPSTAARQTPVSAPDETLSKRGDNSRQPRWGHSENTAPASDGDGLCHVHPFTSSTLLRHAALRPGAPAQGTRLLTATQHVDHLPGEWGPKTMLLPCPATHRLTAHNHFR